MYAVPDAQGALEATECAAAAAAAACAAQGSSAAGLEPLCEQQAGAHQLATAQEQSAQGQAPELQSLAPARQLATGSDSHGSGGGRLEAGSRIVEAEEINEAEEAFDAELGTWLAGRLQRMQPDAELDEGSVRVLGQLLDELTARVLDEACCVNAASAACADADAAAASSTDAGPVAQAAGGSSEPGPRSRPKLSTLTSLDIHKVGPRRCRGSLPGQQPSRGRSLCGLYNSADTVCPARPPLPPMSAPSLALPASPLHYISCRR